MLSPLCSSLSSCQQEYPGAKSQELCGAAKITISLSPLHCTEQAATTLSVPSDQHCACCPSGEAPSSATRHREDTGCFLMPLAQVGSWENTDPMQPPPSCRHPGHVDYFHLANSYRKIRSLLPSLLGGSCSRGLENPPLVSPSSANREPHTGGGCACAEPLSPLRHPSETPCFLCPAPCGQCWGQK